MNSNAASGLASMAAQRRVLYSLVATTCLESGFQSAENSALEALLMMFQGFLNELSLLSKQFCEHAGRTEPLPGDVIMALIEMGIDVKGLPNYAFRQNRVIVPPPSQQTRQVVPKILQTGKKRKLQSNIPDSFPPFPDSHSYVSTPTFKQPITDYETLREKSSTHRRDVERALTRFMARTFKSTNSYSLFTDANLSHLFPLIGIKTDPTPYLSALLPKDQIYEEDNVTESDTDAKSKLEAEGGPNELDKENKDDQVTSNEVDGVDNPYIRPAKVVNDANFGF